MLRHGHVMPSDLDLPEFTLGEFVAFEAYVRQVEKREQFVAGAAVGDGVQP